MFGYVSGVRVLVALSTVHLSYSVLELLKPFSVEGLA